MWTVSRGGGSKPVWGPDGRELFYSAPGAKLMAVDIRTEPEFVAGPPKELFSGYFDGLPGGASFDVSPDGKRFLVVKEDATDVNTEIVVVLHWLDELERLVPTDG